jgi:hypothetical protein
VQGADRIDERASRVRARVEREKIRLVREQTHLLQARGLTAVPVWCLANDVIASLCRSVEPNGRLMSSWQAFTERGAPLVPTPPRLSGRLTSSGPWTSESFGSWWRRVPSGTIFTDTFSGYVGVCVTNAAGKTALNKRVAP